MDRVAAPRFSIVSAVFDVEPYLPEFIASIEAQHIADDDLEVIAVDDGSTDRSFGMLIDWARRSRFLVKVFTKPNGGQGSARNLGLEHVTGEWVTFTDPDDMLDPEYLRVADDFAHRHPHLRIMSAKPFVLREDVGTISDSHPRRGQYRRGNRVANLHDEPNVFLGVSSGSFFRRDRIEAAGLRFDTAIRPNFEDGHFAVRYLLDLPVPEVGLLHDAVYVYRKRTAGNSTLQGSMRHPGRFSDVLELGYLDVLERGRGEDGTIPAWIQHLLIYELSWYLSEDEKIATDIVLPSDIEPVFHDLLSRIIRELEPHVVAAHRARPLRLVWSDIFGHVGRDERWHSAYVVRGKADREMHLVRLSYRYTGEQPREDFLVDGDVAVQAFAKTRAQRYYNRTLINERIIWLPAGRQIQAFLDGAEVLVRWGWKSNARPKHRRGLRKRLARYARMGIGGLAQAVQRRLRLRLERTHDWALRFAASVPPFGRRYADAWVLMDRVNNADDNGERLFEHLRAERPEINAWFAVAAGTPDFARLRATGLNRLVPWGSWRWKLLMLNARWLLSSHADRDLVEPPAVIRAARGRPWKYGFLNHGVIKDDLSLWLNQRDIDLFVVSTRGELGSVADDGTAYVVTHKETRNTGLPRFDRLLAKGRAVPPDERTLVIVAPTWRTWLTLPLDTGTQRRPVSPKFWASEYYQSWSGILASEAVAEAIAARGWRLGFMPHPNIQPILDQLELPGHVEPLAFEGTDVQGTYARCALLVTDYSSVAFNMAYLDRPVVYFQFDRDEMMRGAHMGRQGYFDYERDGFGPVVFDIATAEQAIVESVRRGPSPANEYQARIEMTFPDRDGLACARVVAAVEELSRPYEPGTAGPRPR